ncbi:MFS transporter [Microbulbifer hainanensis]|uniref:MFS transporter n=1 Tax=Microbulbifer hainanensis TaxID=2735675 RepID=UPI001868FAC4|nr:MFS transporter [Microbulbifer hainanensis]
MPTPTPTPTARRGALLFALCVCGFAVTLTYTGIGVALPEIAAELGAGRVAATWVINAFVLVFGASVMAAGTAADRYGRKRTMLLGVVLYILASVAAAAAWNILALDILRGVQGAAAALAMAAAAAAVAHAYRGPEQLKAFALLGASFGAGFAMGPIFVGFTVEYASWRLVFLLGAFLGAGVLVLVRHARMAESKDPHANRLDIPGTLSFMLMLILLTYGLIDAPERGWGHPLVLIMLLGAAVSLALFILVERKHDRPMLDLGLFRHGRFVGLQALPLAAGFGFIAPLALLPFRFMGVEGMGEGESGLALLPLCLPIIFVPILAGQLTRWISAGGLCAGGLVATAAGLTWLAFVPVGASALAFAPPLLLIGVGISFPWGLMDGLAVAVVPNERAGMAVGFFGTSRLVSEGTAIVVTTALLVELLQLRLPSETVSALVFARDLTGETPMSTGVLATYASAFQWTFLTLATVVTLCALAISKALLVRDDNIRESLPGDREMLPASRQKVESQTEARFALEGSV